MTISRSYVEAVDGVTGNGQSTTRVEGRAGIYYSGVLRTRVERYPFLPETVTKPKSHLRDMDSPGQSRWDPLCWASLPATPGFLIIRKVFAWPDTVSGLRRVQAKQLAI